MVEPREVVPYSKAGLASFAVNFPCSLGLPGHEARTGWGSYRRSRTCVEGELLGDTNSEDVEWCNCGTLMAMKLGGEKLLCGSCDADDGHEKRDDATQGGDDGCEVTHGGD